MLRLLIVCIAHEQLDTAFAHSESDAPTLSMLVIDDDLTRDAGLALIVVAIAVSVTPGSE
jgi:hypothetical protein